MKRIKIPLKTQLAASEQRADCWKIRAETAELAIRACRQGCAKLKTERDQFKANWETTADELQDRPEVVIQKTVTVVPWWSWTGCVVSIALFCILLMLTAEVRSIENPTPRPYAVYVDRLKDTLSANGPDLHPIVDDIVVLIKRASAAIENGRPGKADRLLHEAVVEMQR